MAVYIVTSDSKLERVPAPNLPLAPAEWEQRYQDQFANVLRLYFNRLDNYLSKLVALTGTDIGSKINLPYGAFHQDGATTLAADITNNSTTPIQVASTAGFPATGYLLIGTELIKYTTKTSTTFDGTITRGALGTTNVAHTLGADVTEAQGTGSSSTIGSLYLTNTDYSNGIEVDSTDTTKLVCTVPAVYNLQFSAQILNFTSAEDNVIIWFALNGNQIPATASIAEVPTKHGTSPGAYIMTVNILQALAAGDYIQFKWLSETGNSVIATAPAGTSPAHPTSPSLIVTATFVSAYPA